MCRWVAVGQACFEEGGREGSGLEGNIMHVGRLFEIAKPRQTLNLCPSPYALLPLYCLLPLPRSSIHAHPCPFSYPLSPFYPPLLCRCSTLGPMACQETPRLLKSTSGELLRPERLMPWLI